MATFAKSSFNYASYAAFRPLYKPALYEAILKYHHGPRKLCIDLGCGSGQVTRDISKHFDEVIGIDPSEGMIEQAHQASKQASTSFRQGNAEDLSFVADGSVDAVVSGQAAHWFDQTKLWPELASVLSPGGTVAFWAYAEAAFPSHPEASKIVRRYELDDDKLGPYWQQPGAMICQEKLRALVPDEALFEAVERHEYDPLSADVKITGLRFMKENWKVGEVKAFQRTLSAYHGWMEAHSDRKPRSEGGGGDIVDEMFDSIAEVDGTFKDEGKVVGVEWGTGLVMARKRA